MPHKPTAKPKMPTCRQMVAQQCSELGYVLGNCPPDVALESFNAMLRTLFVDGLPRMEKSERACYCHSLAEDLVANRPGIIVAASWVAAEHGFAAGLKQALVELYPDLQRRFGSIGQGRKSRGGKDFEAQIEALLRLAGIPFERQTTEHHLDLIIPDKAMLLRDRSLAMVVSVKRTIRERDNDVVAEMERIRCPHTCLLTAEERLGAKTLERLRHHRVNPVVWDEVKTSLYPDDPVVLGYTEWAVERLARLKLFWPERATD